LKQLTGLHLFGCDLLDTARWELAQVLSKLTNLQSLDLLELRFAASEEREEEEAAVEQQLAAAAAAEAASEPAMVPAAGQPAAAAAAEPVVAAAGHAAMPGVVGWPAILRAVAGLPQLRELSFDGPLNAATVTQLAAATRLQDLGLYNEPTGSFEWEDDSPGELQLINLLCSVPWLRALRLSDQPHLSDAAMPVIGRLLTQLTSLYLGCCTRVSDAGLEYFTGLQQLQELHCFETGVTQAAAFALLPNVNVIVEELP
jgi:hypothetical protein